MSEEASLPLDQHISGGCPPPPVQECNSCSAGRAIWRKSFDSALGGKHAAGFDDYACGTGQTMRTAFSNASGLNGLVM